MKNIKKILSAILLLVIGLLIVGCTTTTTTGLYTLKDFTGKSTDEVVAELDASPLKDSYKLVVKSGLYYEEKEGETVYEYEKFYGYAGHEIGDQVDPSQKINVYVTAYNLPSTLDEFKSTLMTEYVDLESFESLQEIDSVTLEGKDLTGSYINDGLGAVTVTGYVDGDTTRFKDKSGKIISLRYLGVDTPESTASFEPWGKAASNYTKSCLENAKKIALESENYSTEGATASEKKAGTDSNGRYLGWVWYQDQSDQWHLLNLELVMFGYSKSKVNGGSTRSMIIISTGTIISTTGRRIYGEKDPAYDYSTEPLTPTIQELVTHFGDYYARKVSITGVVAIVDAKAPVIVDPETGYGIYYYVPSWTQQGLVYLKEGNLVTVTGVCTYYGIGDSDDQEAALENISENGNGCPQLTDFTKTSVTPVKENGEVVKYTVSKTKLTNATDKQDKTIYPTVLTAGSSNLHSSDIGKYCIFENLLIKKVSVASTGSGFTVYCQDLFDSSNEIAIRVDDSHFYSEKNPTGLNSSDFAVGGFITSVCGYLSFYSDYQLILISTDYINF